jgi:hypothetical protein
MMASIIWMEQRPVVDNDRIFVAAVVRLARLASCEIGPIMLIPPLEVYVASVPFR